MALQRSTFIGDTKTQGINEGSASPMNPAVGKILWHLSLYGSDLKLLLLLLLLCFGCPPLTMDAVSATFVAGWWARIQSNIRSIQIYIFLHYFIDSNKSLLQRPWKIYVQGRPPLRQHGFIESTPLEGRAAPSPWWWYLLVVCVVVDRLVTSRAHCM